MALLSSNVLVNGLIFALIAINVGLFVAAWCLDAAQQRLSVSLGKTAIYDDLVVVTFSLHSSVELLWNSNAKLIAVIIVFFTVVWPLAKIVLLVTSMFMPSRRLRGVVLNVLDLLGKWAFVDVFFLVVLGIVFFIEAELMGGLAQESTALEIQPGIVIYIFAVLLSLVSTQIVLSVHHHVRRGEMAEHLPAPSTADDHRKHSLIRASVLGAVATSLGLFGWGLTCDVVTFEFGGYLGVQGHLSDATFTPLEVGHAVLTKTYNAEDFSTWLIVLLFFFVVVAAPILNAVVAVAVWLPLPPSSRTMGLRLFKTISAWASTDVFLVSLVIALAQLNTLVQSSQIGVSKFLAEKYPCADEKNGTSMTGCEGNLQAFVALEMRNNCGPDATTVTSGVVYKECLTVDPELKRGFWILLTSVVIFYWAGVATCVVLRSRFVEENEDEDEGDKTFDVEAAAPLLSTNPAIQL